MLIGVFKSNQKLVNGLVVLVTVFLWIPSFFVNHDKELTNFSYTAYLWFDLIIAIALVSGQAIYLNFIVNEYKLVENNSHLTALIFVIFNSATLLLFNLNGVLIANTFLLLGIHQLLRLYGTKGAHALSFNAGFLMAIAAVIYAPNVIFILFVWFGIIYMLSPKWRDFIVPLIGFSLPHLYLACYNFVFEDFVSFLPERSAKKVFNFSWDELSVFVKVLVLVVSGIILLAIPSLIARLSSGLLRTRKMLVLISCMLFFGLGILFFNKADYLAAFVVLTIPLSVVGANFFQRVKRQWLSESLFLTLLLLIIFGYFS